MLAKFKISKINEKTLILVFVYIACAAVFLLNVYSEPFNNIVACGVLILSFILIWRHRNNMLLLLMSLFIGYCNYSIVAGIYLSPNLRPKYLYPQITDIEVYGIGIAMLFLFMLTIVCLASKFEGKWENSFARQFVRSENSNYLLFFLAFFVFMFINIYGYQRFGGGRGSSSAIYEYGTIFVIMMFYYCGDKKLLKYLTVMSCSIYILTSILNGTRIEALICLFILIICFAKNSMPKWMLYIGMFIGIVIFSSIGTIRGNWSGLQDNFVEIAGKIFENRFVFDTCTHAYFPMLCMIEQFKQYSFGSGSYYLLRFLMSVALGSSKVPDGNLIMVMDKYYYHNNGGVTIGFFYVWFSYLGSFIFAVITNKFMKFISLASGKVTDGKLCVIMYVVASVPRWYLYGPWSMFRGVLICLLIFYLFGLADKVIMRRKRLRIH